MPALAAALAAGLVTAMVGALVVGTPAAGGALAGTAVVVVFFGLGATVLQVTTRVVPGASLLVALLTYTLQVVLVGLVFVVLGDSGLLDSIWDGTWLGVAVIVATFGWLGGHLWSSMRARVLLYDLPSSEPATTTGGGRRDGLGRAHADVSGADEVSR